MIESEKFVSLETLEKVCTSLKLEGKKVVLCHGTFDLLHVGHIKHLQAAKKLGDVLIVTITADEYVNKGPDRPVFKHNLRAENLSALECVNYVAINYSETSVNVLELLKPNVYVKGDEYKDEKDDVTGNIQLERQSIEKHGGIIEYTQEVTFSSSKLLNQYFEVFTPKTKKFLDDFKNEFEAHEIHNEIDKLNNLEVLVIGDGIIDEYHYVEQLGQSGKGNFQAVRYQEGERFAGGAFAVANHVSGFVKQVTLVTAIGDKDEDEKFIRSKLNVNVKPVLFNTKNERTLTKRRYVDKEMNKFFEVYFNSKNLVNSKLENKIISWLEDNTSKFDIVIVPDFGNGLISSGMINVLAEKSRFLSVNTQINSGNRGYHVITRYPKADFISLNEPEIRMAAHDKYSELPEVISKVSNQLKVPYSAVTRGPLGVVLYELDSKKIVETPAISTKVIDRIGAGDAFFSMSSLCLGNKMGGKLSTFVGSVAAALSVQIVCNREYTEPVGVKKYITTLLK